MGVRQKHLQCLQSRPDLVNMTVAPKDVIPKLPDNVRIYWKFNELTDTGATGAPRKATRAKRRQDNKYS